MCFILYENDNVNTRLLVRSKKKKKKKKKKGKKKKKLMVKNTFSEQKIDDQKVNSPIHMPSEMNQLNDLNVHNSLFSAPSTEINEAQNHPYVPSVLPQNVLISENRHDELISEEGKQTQNVMVENDADDKFNALVGNFQRIDIKFETMTQNVTTMFNNLQQKSNNDNININKVNQHFQLTITNLYQQMCQQIQTLTNKLVQNQKTSQQNITYLQQQIMVLTQKQHSKDHELRQLLQEVNQLKSYNNINNDNNNISEEDKVRIWLRDKIKLPQYFNLFVENGYDDLDIIADMNQDDLREIGINRIGHRKKILKYIKLLNQSNQ
eukprot:529561_1